MSPRVWAVLSLWSWGNKPIVTRESWRTHGLDTSAAYPELTATHREAALTVSDLLRCIAALPDLSRVHVHHGCATELPPYPGAVVYLDPPYQGTTGYGHTLSRADVLALAERWRSAGAVVAVSEAEPLPLAGWHTHRLPRPCGVVRSWSAQQSEYLTISREPRGQVALFA